MKFSNLEKDKIKSLCDINFYKLDFDYLKTGNQIIPSIKITFKNNFELYFQIVIQNEIYQITYTNINVIKHNISKTNFDDVYSCFVNWIKDINNDYNLNYENNYISKISPRFYPIYKEAKQTQNLGLNEICGMGYRKAFEVLIKDYIIYLNPNDDTVKIKKGILPNTKNNKKFGELLTLIAYYFNNDSTIITACKSCAYLGNDHSHYENTKINDINDLIDAINKFLEYIKLEYNHKTEKLNIENDIENINKNIKEK